MNLQFHPVAVLYFSSCAFALAMFYISRHLPDVRGSRIWGIVMLFCAVWSAGEGFQTLVADLDLKLFILRVSYLGVVGTAVFWSLFIVIYSNNERLLNNRVKIILSIPPVVTYLSILTLHLHPYFFKSVELVNTNGFSSLSMVYGPVFWAWTVFAYAAIFGSGVLLVQSVLRFPHHFRGQIFLLAMAGLMPLLSNFLFITGHNFLGPFSPTSPVFVISGLLVGINFRRNRFLDVVPVAHDLVFQHVNTGVIVLDNRGVVVEMNPEAEKMTGRVKQEMIGQPVQKTLVKRFGLPETFFDEMKHTNEVKEGAKVYELQQTPLVDPAGRHTGRIILLYDITALKQSEEELSAANEMLKKMAATDPLTSLSNRRDFFGLAQRELARAQRRQHCFSLILLDLDNFKTVNDTLGHPRGDMVLQETARCLKMYSRSGDILGRYGGDEFIVLAYEADLHEAMVLARRYCEIIPPRLAALGPLEVPVTLSIGVAMYDKEEKISLDTLLDRADAALYESKKGGRNRVSVWRSGDAGSMGQDHALAPVLISKLSPGPLLTAK